MQPIYSKDRSHSSVIECEFGIIAILDLHSTYSPIKIIFPGLLPCVSQLHISLLHICFVSSISHSFLHPHESFKETKAQKESLNRGLEAGFGDEVHGVNDVHMLEEMRGFMKVQG